MTLKQKVDHWRDLASRDIKGMRSLMADSNYVLALYHGQQAIEKLFKALCTTQNITSPLTHSLTRLAQVISYPLNPEEITELQIISEFNMICRYDNLTASFIKTCTKQYATTWVKTIEKWYKHLRLQTKQERKNLPNNTQL